MQTDDMKGSTVKDCAKRSTGGSKESLGCFRILAQRQSPPMTTKTLSLRPVTVRVELVVVVGVSTWLKEFHPLILWQIGEIPTHSGDFR